MRSAEVAKALAEAPEAVARGIVQWMPRAAPYVVRELSAEVRAQQRSYGNTGQGAASVRVLSMDSGGFTVGPSAPHMVFFIKGTRPHVIRPRFAKALAFADTGGGVARRGTSKTGQAFTMRAVQGPLRPGQKRGSVKTGVIFAKGVNHPGTRPHGILEPTAERVAPVVRRMLTEAVREELAGIGLRSLFGGA